MIKFESVSKHFGPYTAVEDVSFEIEDEELVVITGPSGAGKTSLMRLLTQEYTADEGDIWFDDIEVTDLPRSRMPQLRRDIGVVFQDYKLLNERTVWENIELALDIVGTPRSEREDRIFDLLELVGIDEKVDLFPAQLSGGEAQRVAIARALATAPEAIFADEPTGNLDAETAIAITKLLKKINDLGTTVVIATHDPNVLQTLGEVRVIQIRNGTVETNTGAIVEDDLDDLDDVAETADEDEDNRDTKEAPPTDETDTDEDDNDKSDTKSTDKTDDESDDETPQSAKSSRFGQFFSRFLPGGATEKKKKVKRSEKLTKKAADAAEDASDAESDDTADTDNTDDGDTKDATDSKE